MSEFKHWQEDGAPPEFVRLLRAARCEQPPPASLRRALLAAGVVAAASVASTAAAATVSNAAIKGLAGAVTKWMVVGALSAGMVATTAVVLQHHRAATVQVETSVAPSHTPQGLRLDGAVPPPRQVLPTSAAVMASNVPMATAPSALAPAAPRRTTRPNLPDDTPRAPAVVQRVAETVQPSRPASGSTLAEEMALIDQARARLRAGSAADALQYANEYNRRFTSGRFAPEALYLIMQARTQLGQPQAAADAAREIVQRFPDGPQVGRAREILQLH